MSKFLPFCFRLSSHKTQLMVSAASGGVWRFPLRVLATEPEVDDTITIESVGLNKEAVVGFRLTSQMRWVSCQSQPVNHVLTSIEVWYSTKFLQGFLFQIRDLGGLFYSTFSQFGKMFFFNLIPELTMSFQEPA